MSDRKRIEIEIIEDDDFDLSGFQVTHGEYFAQTYEPSLTFSGNQVYVNTACIRALPQFNYIQILVNPERQMVAVYPCSEEEKDSFRWCSATEKRSPRHITSNIFVPKVFTLMNWDPGFRYKLEGKLIRRKGELLFAYDLTSYKRYERTVSEDGKVQTSRTAAYPPDWQNQFGVPFSEHKNRLVVSVFKDKTVFGLQKDPEDKPQGISMHVNKAERGEMNGAGNDERNGTGTDRTGTAHEYEQLSLT